MCYLTGVMDHVTGDDRLLALRCDMYAHVSGGMPGRRFQPDFVGHLMSRLHQVSHVRVENGLHGIFDYGPIFLDLVFPVSPFLFRKKITGVAERRLPVSVHQAGVPANVIHVHVRTQNGVHRVGREPGGSKFFKEVCLHSIPARVAALFIVTDASVHQNRLA